MMFIDARSALEILVATRSGKISEYLFLASVSINLETNFLWSITPLEIPEFQPLK